MAGLEWQGKPSPNNLVFSLLVEPFSDPDVEGLLSSSSNSVRALCPICSTPISSRLSLVSSFFT